MSVSIITPNGTSVSAVSPPSSGGATSSSNIGELNAPAWKSPFSGAWGTTPTPTEKAVILGYKDGSGTSGFVSLQCTGDTDSFKLTEVEGEDLGTPQTFAVLTNDHDFMYIAFKGTLSGGNRNIEIKIEPVFNGGVAKTMTIAAVDHEGNSVGTISASATIEDAFKGAIAAPGADTLVGLWAAKPLLVGAGATFSNGDSSLRNYYSTNSNADDLKAFMNGDRSPAVAAAVTSYTVKNKASGFTTDSLSGEVYVDIPQVTSGNPIWSNTYWTATDEAKTDSMGVNTTLTADDMWAWFMVVRNDKWMDANNEIAGWLAYARVGGPGSGIFNTSGSDAGDKRYLANMRTQSAATGAGYGDIRFEIHDYISTNNSFYAGAASNNEWITIACMRDPSDTSIFRWWYSKVGGAFGGLNSYVQTGMSPYQPVAPKQWSIWPYGNIANSASPVRLSVAAVAGWDTSWDESSEKYFEAMHDKVL